MSDLAWTIAVVGFFITVLASFGMLNRDTRGATLIAIAIILVGFIVFSISGCAISEARRPWLEAGMSYDRDRTVGGQPTCVVRIRAPLGWKDHEDWIIASYEHLSSCPDQNDAGEVNHVEVVAKIPLGRRKGQ